MKNKKENLLKLLKESNTCYDSVFKQNLIKKIIKNPVKFFIRKIDLKILKRKFAIPLKSKTFWGEKINILNFEQDIYFCGLIGHESELRLTKFLIKNITDNSVFFDIGAHHGFYSMLANQLISSGSIHSFEPSPFHFSILEKNTNKHERTKANNTAIHNENGNFVLQESNKGTSTMNDDFLKNSQLTHKEQYKKTEIQTITLDDYCNKKNLKPNIIKLDVEGNEFNSLSGGKSTLERIQPVIIIEIVPFQELDRNYTEAISLLKRLGYTPFKIDEQGDLISVKNINSEIKNIPKNDFNNFVFKKSKK